MSSTASPGPFDISGKVALVTGSSRGIGSALATGLAEAGAVVVLNSRNSDVLEAERRRIADATGATVHAYAFDVTDSAAVRDAATRIEAEVGPVEIVVNNTGVQHRAPLLEFGDDDFRRVMDTNLTSAFYVGREFARGMVERGHGRSSTSARCRANSAERESHRTRPARAGSRCSPAECALTGHPSVCRSTRSHRDTSTPN